MENNIDYYDYYKKWRWEHRDDIELLKMIIESILKGEIIVNYGAFFINVKWPDGRYGHWKKIPFYYKLKNEGG